MLHWETSCVLFKSIVAPANCLRPEPYSTQVFLMKSTVQLWNLHVWLYVTLGHKTSYKCKQSEQSFHWCMVCYNIWLRYNYLNIWNLRVPKKINIEKITFNAMHVTNQKLRFYIFTVENLQNIFMEHDLNILMVFGLK